MIVSSMHVSASGNYLYRAQRSLETWRSLFITLASNSWSLA